MLGWLSSAFIVTRVSVHVMDWGGSGFHHSGQRVGCGRSSVVSSRDGGFLVGVGGFNRGPVHCPFVGSLVRRRTRDIGSMTY